MERRCARFRRRTTVWRPPGLTRGKTFAFVITNSHAGLLVLQTNRAGDGVLYGVGQFQ